jgi:hypothetical protein
MKSDAASALAYYLSTLQPAQLLALHHKIAQERLLCILIEQLVKLKPTGSCHVSLVHIVHCLSIYAKDHGDTIKDLLTKYYDGDKVHQLVDAYHLCAKDDNLSVYAQGVIMGVYNGESYDYSKE